MKGALILSLILFVLPVSLPDLTKDNLVVFSSLSYYGCDFDGDRLGDLAVWDPRKNTLYFQLTTNNEFYNKRFFENDLKYIPVFADYDGDEKTDFGFFQPDTAQWILYLTTTPGIPSKLFLGATGDLPSPANIDGDNQYEPTIWRPTNSAWLLSKKDEKGNVKQSVVFDGSFQDSAFSGDYDGDGKSDLLNWRPDDGYWHIVKSGTEFDFNQSEHIQHGQEWDIIIPNDYNADKRCDLVFWRPEDKKWYFFYAGSQNQKQITFGEKGDIPASLDIDGDGIPELVMWNMGKKSWNVLNTKNNESYSYKWHVPDGCIPAISILHTFE